DLEGELPQLAKSLGITERVSFNFTMLPEPDRILHYAAADVATFPSLYEPFGIVALEAMSMGKPVVVGARGVSGMREIVVASGPNQCGYHINPYDPNDIAWGLNSLLSDKAHMQLLGRNARERVLSEFTWDKVGERCLSIYREVLDSAKTAKS
ncbi:MAG: glycosyltransferase, partial [Candidatus Methanomethylicia archaeon]|nr:glycosyltransferase [Candidatus Methanomethylicia archaeon]